MPKRKFLEILSFFTFPIIVFSFSIFIDEVFNAYEIMPWIDIPMHFIGGLSIAYTITLFLEFFREKKFIEIRKKFLSFLFIISLVALVAVLWEFYEFFLKEFFNVNTQPSLEDTLLDFLMGLLGGATGAWVFRNI